MIRRVNTAPRPRRTPYHLLLLLALLTLAACGGGVTATLPPVAPTTGAAPAPSVAPSAAPSVAPSATRPPGQSPTPTRPTASSTPRAAATATRPAATVTARTTATRGTATAEGGTTIILNGQPEITRAGLPGEALTTIVAARDGRTLYAGGKGVWRSLDAGATWTPMRTAEEAPTVSTIAIAPSDPAVIYIGVGQGCGRGGRLPGYVTTNGGESWRAIGQNINSLIVDPLNAKKVYAADCTGLRRSIDGGVEWETLTSADLSGYTPTLIAMAPNSAKTIYVAYTNEAGLVRMRRTINDGVAWQEASLPSDLTGALALTVAPGNGDTAYLTTSVGVYETKTGGARWAKLNGDGLAAITPARPPANGPLDYQLASTLLIDPSQPTNLWLGTGSGRTAGIGVFRSRDGGATWKRTGTGIDGRIVRAFAITTTRTASTLYIATDDGLWSLTTRYEAPPSATPGR